MDWIIIDLVINVIAPWLLFSYLVYVATCYITQKSNSSPHVWWLALTTSFLPLVPTPFSSMKVTIPDIAPLSFGLENAQIITNASIAHASLTNSDLLTALFLVLYIGFTSFKLIQLVISWRSLERLSKATCLFDCAKTTQITTVISALDHSPFIFGLTKPKIVLPSYFPLLTKAQQKILLQHELTHITNRDHLSVFIWRILSTVLWLNPVIRKMEGQFIRAMEHRCDNLTIERFEVNKQLYANTLLASLKRSINQQNHSPVAQFNSHALSVDDYKTRLTNIIQPTEKKQRLLTIKCCSVALVLASGWLFVKQAEVAGPVRWQQPLENFSISSSFSTVSKVRNYIAHQGVDYVAEYGSPVFSAADGIVIVADDMTLNSNYGNAVLIQHKDGYQTLYSHLESISVAAGSWVNKGQSIGIIGETGKATGVHLHFEVRKDKQRLDPAALLGD